MVPCGPMRRWAMLLLLLAVALFASRNNATQVHVVLRTNVPYASGAGVCPLVQPLRRGRHAARGEFGLTRTAVPLTVPRPTLSVASTAC